MPFSIPKELLDAGGWVAAAAVALGWVGAILRGDMVPGSVHRREIDRADKATAQLERLLDSTHRSADQVATVIELLSKILSRERRDR